MQGLICLRDACKLSADDYRDMWEHSRRNATSAEIFGANRQMRAMKKENLTESRSWVIESQRRLDLLHVEYEIRRLLPQSNKASTNGCDSEHAIAEQEFSKLANVDLSQTRAKRRNVRPYLHLAKYEHGLGLMLLLGVQTRKQ